MSEDHSPGALRPGRYQGGNDSVELVLRLDPKLGIDRIPRNAGRHRSRRAVPAEAQQINRSDAVRV
jgi:hypothetical protein